MFGNEKSRPCRGQRGRRRNIDRSGAVSARADDFPDFKIREARKSGCSGKHGFGGTADFGGRLPFGFESGQNCTQAHRIHFTREHGFKKHTGFGFREVVPAAKRFQKVREVMSENHGEFPLRIFLRKSADSP